MSDRDELDLRTPIQDAEARLTLAHGELEIAMAELTITTRSDKRMVTERLRRAMAELVAARSSLAAALERAP